MASLREALEIRTALVQRLRARQDTDSGEQTQRVEAAVAAARAADASAAEADQRAAQLHRHLAHVQRSLKVAEEEASRRSEETASLSAELERQRQATSDALAALGELQVERRDATARAELPDEAARVLEALSERDAARSDVERLNAELRAMGQDLESARAQGRDLDQKAATALDELAATRSALERITAERISATSALNLVCARADGLEQRLSEVTHELEASPRLAASREDASKIRALQSELDDLQRELASVTVERDEARSQAKDLAEAGRAPVAPASGTLSIAERLRQAVASHQALTESSQLPVLEEQLRAARQRIRELELRDGRWVPFTADEVADRRLDDGPVSVWFQGEADDDLDLLGAAPRRVTRRYVAGVWSPSPLAPPEVDEDSGDGDG